MTHGARFNAPAASSGARRRVSHSRAGARCGQGIELTHQKAKQAADASADGAKQQRQADGLLGQRLVWQVHVRHPHALALRHAAGDTRQEALPYRLVGWRRRRRDHSRRPVPQRRGPWPSAQPKSVRRSAQEEGDYYHPAKAWRHCSGKFRSPK